MLVAATVIQHGIEGLILATMLSGVILRAMALLRLGTFIKYIPYPVTVGFTAGIAVIIFASQVKELLGLTLAGPEPGPLVLKLQALAAALPTVNPAAIAVAGFALHGHPGPAARPTELAGLPHRGRARSVLATIFDLPVGTIGTRFGGIPAALPAPACPTCRSRASPPSCQQRCPSPCSALSRACSPRWSRTA